MTRLSHADTIRMALDARTGHQGEITLPCVPAALEHYVARLQELFALQGKPLQPHEVTRVRQMLEDNLRDGFSKGSSTTIVVQYEITSSPSLKKNLGLRVGVRIPTLEQQFASWTQRHGDTLFGKQPDARVMAEVKLLRERPAAVLDVGAGPGRNAIPIARLGHTVDAIELSPEFCHMLQTIATQENLPVQVTRGNALEESVSFATQKYSLIFASEVVSHFRHDNSLREFLRRTTHALRVGGRLLFNIFLPRPGYTPDELAREASELAWASLFYRDDLTAALEGLPLRQLDDQPVHDYEQQHLPAEAWPPTPWFVAWTTGRSIFPVLDDELPPVEMRWLLFEKLGV